MTSLRAWIEQADVDAWAVLSASFRAPPGWVGNMTPKRGDFRFRSVDGLLVTPFSIQDAQRQEWIYLAVSRGEKSPTVPMVTIEDVKTAIAQFGKPRSSVWLSLFDMNSTNGQRNKVNVWLRCDNVGMPFADADIDVNWIQQVSKPLQSMMVDAYGRPVLATYGQQAPSQAIYGQQAPSQATYGQQAQPQAVYGQQVPSQATYGQQAQPQAVYGQQVQPQTLGFPVPPVNYAQVPQGHQQPMLADYQQTPTPMALAQAQLTQAQAAQEARTAQLQAAQEQLAQALAAKEAQEAQVQEAQAQLVQAAHSQEMQAMAAQAQLAQAQAAQAQRVQAQLAQSQAAQAQAVLASQAQAAQAQQYAQVQAAQAQAAQAQLAQAQAMPASGDRTWVPQQAALPPVVPTSGNGSAQGAPVPPLGGDVTSMESLLAALMATPS